MNDHLSKVLLTAILLCLLVLAFKPNVQPQPVLSAPGYIQSADTVIKLEGDKIAVIDTNRISGLWGTMLVFTIFIFTFFPTFNLE